MKIILFSESPLINHKGNFYSKDTWIKFPLFFSKYCELFTVVCTTKKIDKINFEEYSKIEIKKTKVIFISDYSSFGEYYKKIIFNKRIWKKKIYYELEKHDIVWIRTPSPIAKLIFKSKNFKEKKTVCFLAGDIKKQSDSFINSNGLKKAMYGYFIKRYIRLEQKIYNKVDLMYYYSDELFNRFKHIKTKKIPFRTPIISNSDIYEKFREIDLNDIKIMRVCWLLPSKGIEYLIESIRVLRDKKFNVSLSIIGAEREVGYKNKLLRLIDEKNLNDYINMLGWKSPNEIKKLFRKHDIHVISSLSEGTPRVILESLSNSIPLVTTNVGGISTMLNDNKDCIMVDAGSSSQIASAVEKILNDNNLRRSIIKNGIINSKEWTFEKKSLDVLNDMKKLTG